MPPEKRRPQRPLVPALQQRRREGEVVQAAIEVFWAKGYTAATIQDVADKLGMLKGSLYYYIDSKEHLLVKIFQLINRDAAAILQEAAAQQAPPLDRLHWFVRTYLEYFFARYELMSLYFTEWSHLTGEYRSEVLAQRAEFEVVVRDLIRQAQADGTVPADLDDRHAAFFILSAVNSVATWYRREGHDTPEIIAASYARMATGLLVGAGIVAGPAVPDAGARRTG